MNLELLVDEGKIILSILLSIASTSFNRYLTSFQVVLPIAIFLLFWCLPTPGGVSIQAWHLLAIFLGTIASFITKPLPMGASALVALAIALLTNSRDDLR